MAENTNVSHIPNVETKKSNPNTKNTKGKLATLMSSVALASALVINPANSTDISPNSATVVADGDIDNSVKLIQINQKIDSLQISLAKIENKNDLSLEEKRERYHLKKQIRVLDKERDAIRDEMTQTKKEKLDIIDNKNTGKKETIAIIDNESEKLDKEAKQKDEVIKAKLNGIKQALNNK